MTESKNLQQLDEIDEVTDDTLIYGVKEDTDVKIPVSKIKVYLSTQPTEGVRLSREEW